MHNVYLHHFGLILDQIKLTVNIFAVSVLEVRGFWYLLGIFGSLLCYWKLSSCFRFIVVRSQRHSAFPVTVLLCSLFFGSIHFLLHELNVHTTVKEFKMLMKNERGVIINICLVFIIIVQTQKYVYIYSNNTKHRFYTAPQQVITTK